MELNTKQLSGVVVLAMLIGFGGAVTYSEDSTYYCESRDIVLDCHRTTATRCYYNVQNNYKVCKSGWEPIEKFITKPVEPIKPVIIKHSDKILGNYVLIQYGEYVCKTSKGVLQSNDRCIPYGDISKTVTYGDIK